MRLVEVLILGLLITLPAVRAAELGAQISDADRAKFDEILTPVLKIYNFIKYTASIIAVIAMLITGIMYMFSGSDIAKRQNAKNTATYILIGLTIVWAAPFVVNLLVS